MALDIEAGDCTLSFDERDAVVALLRRASRMRLAGMRSPAARLLEEVTGE